jgi:uncharacterized protein YukE
LEKRNVVGASSSLKVAAKGSSGLRIALDLTTPLAYLDIEADFVIRIDGLPEDCSLTAGRPGTDGWTLGRAEIGELAVIAPANFDEQLPLTVIIQSPDAAQIFSRFDLLVTARGARSAFSHLEPEDRDGEKAPVKRMRKSVAKGRGRLAAKTIKRALTFGDTGATEEFVAHRSASYLDALFHGDLSQKQGEPMEVTMGVEQRIALARSLWEGEAKDMMARAKQQWEQESKSLRTRIAELEEQLKQALELDD